MSAAALTHPLRWLAERDRDLVALRRAGADGDRDAGDVRPRRQGDRQPALATFAAFGSFAMLLLVDFGGPMRERLQAAGRARARRAARSSASARSSPQNVWLAAVTTAVVGFAVIFAGVVSSVLASATTSLLLAFILPVSLAGPVSSIPDRLAGWGLAAGAALVAIGCCGRRRPATRCARRRSPRAGRWRRGCARRSPTR